MSIRNLNFVKIDGQWYLNLPSFNGKGESLNMTDGVVELLEFLAEGREDVNVRLLRKNTTEQVKVAMARRQYIRGGAIYVSWTIQEPNSIVKILALRNYG